MIQNAILCFLLLGSTLVFSADAIPAAECDALVTVQAGDPGRTISPDLVGIFFEDINYAGDGGLYAELVQNRSFEYQATEQLTWTPMTGWELVTRDDGRGSLSLADAVPLHPNNPHYIVVETVQPGAGVGLINSGFDGIPVQAGEQYDFSVFARQLFTGDRWGGSGILANPAKLVVRLETKERVVLGEAALEVSGRDWRRLASTITATGTDSAARLAVLSLTKGAVALDEISLFPRKTFKSRPNGLRADLAQAIADLKPKFMRFPGGCLVHGHGLGNMYRWKDSIGPIEQGGARQICGGITSRWAWDILSISSSAKTSERSRCQWCRAACVARTRTTRAARASADYLWKKCPPTFRMCSI